MINSKLTITQRHKTIGGTYDITLEEVERVRVFPEDEVREIISQAIQKGKLDIDNNPDKYVRLFNIFDEMARIALFDIQSRFDLTIKPKSEPAKAEKGE